MNPRSYARTLHRIEGRTLRAHWLRSPRPLQSFGSRASLNVFASPIFPTRFPTELLTTGWEMAGLDGRRLVKNA